jgi:sec-independent protein translocase protein TatA
MPNLRGSEWIILLLLVLVLFGAKRLPDAARGLGRSLRIFKAETQGLRNDKPPTEPVAELPPVAEAPEVAPEKRVPEAGSADR